MLLRSLIVYEKLFTLDALNDRILGFDFGYNVAKDKPSTIGQSNLSTEEGQSLGQSGLIRFVYHSSVLDVTEN